MALFEQSSLAVSALMEPVALVPELLAVQASLLSQIEQQGQQAFDEPQILEVR